MSSDKVAVIGGGPGGLRAAQCVAEVGGEVVLIEQRDFLGGTPVAENYAGLTPRGEPAQPQILSWFSGFGMNVPISAGGGTAFLNVFKVDVTNFVNQFLVGYFAPVVAAWLVLRAVVDISEGRSPLSSILGAMFLLSIASTQALLQGWNSGTKFATADVLAGLWTYTASRILPVAAGMAIIGAILNFAFGKPAMRLICCAAGFLTVAALWRLVVSMM